MKRKIISIIVVFTFLFLCSCSFKNNMRNDTVTASVISELYKQSTEQYEDTSDYEFGTSKEILNRDIKYYPDSKVKEHTYESTHKYELLPKIIRFKTKYLYLYANSHAEEIFNLINARDKDALMQMFSPYYRTKDSERFSWEVDVLFKYVDETILDYDEDRYPVISSEHYSYGECLETVISANITAHTENTEYLFHISYTLANEDEEKIGLSWISVTEKKIDDYWTNEFDSSKDTKSYSTADNPNICIQCKCIDYHFGVDGVPVYD